MYGYRRWGHNETDEPAFTQPVLYRAIQQRPSIRESYFEHLRQLNGVTVEEAEEIARRRREKLEQQLNASRQKVIEAASEREGAESDPTTGPEPAAEPETVVEAARLTALLEQLARLPDGFRLHPKLERSMAARRKMAAGQQPPLTGQLLKPWRWRRWPQRACVSG
jgi:2-oxoglutarate dehydrogenase E1 component